MIKDVIIVKDGMPILSKNFGETPSAFSKSDNLIMLSGFFSAINSFSDQFDGLGSVSELKLSNADELRLSFLRDPSLPNLVYLATFDEKTKGVNVQRVLRKISSNFLQKYNAEKILQWRGRKDTFKAFEETIHKHVDEEKSETEPQFKQKVLDLFQDVKERIDEGKNEEDNHADPSYLSNVPKSLVPRKMNVGYYTTGKITQELFKLIDGNKTIKEIAAKLDTSPEKAHESCKNLMKMGFITY